MEHELVCSDWLADECIVADHAGVESAYVWNAALLRDSCMCACAVFAITGWVVNRNNNFDRAKTAWIKLNAKVRMISESVWTCVNTVHLLKRESLNVESFNLQDL